MNGAAQATTNNNNRDNRRRSSLQHQSNNNNSNNKTFDAQGSLARLPIPSLDETLTKFLATVGPLLSYSSNSSSSTSQSVQEETRQLVESFRTGEGPKLQQLLLEYEAKGAETGTFGSYVEEFWNDSYLAPDSSVVLNLNPYFILESGPDRRIATNQLHRAASLCFASLKMASMLKHETLPPDIFKGRRT